MQKCGTIDNYYLYLKYSARFLSVEILFKIRTTSAINIFYTKLPIPNNYIINYLFSIEETREEYF